MRRPWATEGCCAKNKQTNLYVVPVVAWLWFRKLVAAFCQMR